MKRILILLCGAGLALCPAIHAQDATPSPTTSGTESSNDGGGRRHGRWGGQMNADTMLQRLTKTLDLTADQQAKIKPILDTEVSAIQAARQDTGADSRSKMRDARQTANTQIKAVLTPDQQTKFDAMHQRRGGGRRGGGGGDGGSDASASPSAQQ